MPVTTGKELSSTTGSKNQTQFKDNNCHSSNYFKNACLFLCECVHDACGSMYHSAHVEDREQLYQGCSFFPLLHAFKLQLPGLKEKVFTS